MHSKRWMKTIIERNNLYRIKCFPATTMRGWKTDEQLCNQSFVRLCIFFAFCHHIKSTTTVMTKIEKRKQNVSVSFMPFIWCVVFLMLIFLLKLLPAIIIALNYWSNSFCPFFHSKYKHSLCDWISTARKLCDAFKKQIRFNIWIV